MTPPPPDDSKTAGPAAHRFVQDVLDAAAGAQKPFYIFRKAAADDSLCMRASEDGPPQDVPFAVAVPGDTPQTILERIRRLPFAPPDGGGGSGSDIQ